MSTIRKYPFIERVVRSLSSENLTALRNLLDTPTANPEYTVENLPQATGVYPITFVAENNKVYSSIYIRIDIYRVLISYHRFQDLLIFEIDNNIVKKVNEYLDINELRRIIGDAMVEAGQLGSGDAEYGQVLTADGAGGTRWMPVVTENIISFSNVNISSGSVTLNNTGANWALMTETSIGCALILYLATQNVYPLGSEVELKRISVSENEVLFGGTFDYLNGGTYITYTISAKCSSNYVVVSITEMEANKGGVSDNPLADLTIGGESYTVLTADDVVADNYTRKTYVVGDLVVYNNLLYKCITAVNVAEDFDSAKWARVKLDEYVLNHIESFTIQSSSWTTDSNIAPFTVKANITISKTLSANTIVELINDDAISFATYGFSIGAISGQVATIYALEAPSANVGLKIKVED